MRRLAPALAALLAGALIALLAYGLLSEPSTATIEQALSEGRRPEPPKRTLISLDGRPDATLADFRGRIVVLNIFASWCQPCREEAPILREVQRDLERSGDGTVVAVSYRDARSDSLAFLEEFDLDFPAFRDVEGKFVEELGTTGLPETFVLDRRGRIAAVSRGTVSESFLRKQIERLR